MLCRSRAAVRHPFKGVSCDARCAMGDQLPRRMTDFARFCRAARAWVVSAPMPDVALIAAADFLASRADERMCDTAAAAMVGEDTHAVLGVGVLVALWHSKSA
jgi:hypothetical protein